jgi:Winged helix DNA-binding domain
MPASTLRRQSVTSNIFPEIGVNYRHGGRGFLTDHARVLLCVAHDPGMCLRDIATRLNITERCAHGIITDLTAAGYLVKQKDGRRNRFQVQAHLPLPACRERTVGEVPALLTGNDRPSIELPRQMTLTAAARPKHR